MAVPASEAEAALHALGRKGFAQRARTSSVADESEYTFLHLLVRDVAYGQIPRGERAEKHRRAAEWIESLGRPEDSRGDARLSLPLRAGVGAVEQTADGGARERARVALREAGDRATALNAFDAAARSYGSALELWPRTIASARGCSSPMALRSRLDRRPAKANLSRQRAPSPPSGSRAWQHRRRSCSQTPPGGRASAIGRTRTSNGRCISSTTPRPPQRRRRCSVRFRATTCSRSSRASDPVGREALEMAAEFGLEEVRAHALNNIGTARVNLGDTGGIGDLEAQYRISDGLGSPESLRGYNNLFANHVSIGDARRRRRMPSAPVCLSPSGSATRAPRHVGCASNASMSPTGRATGTRPRRFIDETLV